MSLPANLDPCDFLLKEGADAFRELVAGAVDPLAFVLERAAARFDFNAIEGSRRAAEWVLGILSRIPATQRIGMDMKLAKSLDSLAHRLGLPVDQLEKTAARAAAGGGAAAGSGATRESRPRMSPPGPTAAGVEPGSAGKAAAPPIRPRDLDPLDRELVEIVLNEPGLVSELVSRVTVASLRDAPLRAILQACYDLHGEGQTPRSEEVSFASTTPRFAPWRRVCFCRWTRRPCPKTCVPLPGKIASKACSAPWPSASGKTGWGTCAGPWPKLMN